jgi:large subunit ribosomal protein L9
VEHEARQQEEQGKIAEELDGKELHFKAKAGAKGRLHGSVTASSIAEELSRVTGLDIDKKKVEMEEPLHHVGEYDIAINLGTGTQAKIKVIIEEETPQNE